MLELNKNELKEMFNNLKIGDMFRDIKIEGVKDKDTDDILQELARRKNLQFEITYPLYDDKVNIIYEVIQPSKKFLNKRGCWSMPISKETINFLDTIE
ncbi:hypothetical protein K144316041_p21610 (plasmid) [Clostridium tetani]|uniref:hypothetical protein n=1 Tax=Clostridium tetani TaxID=1513 RepID=UPI00295502D7|nr:hypothetical protein [Clostridium tetani]BDR74322.1 hypothetical protein K144316041_p21610 [Clostridium tetani]